MLDRQEGLFALLVHDSRQLRVLLLHLFDDFFLDTLLFHHSVFHGGAFLEGCASLVEQVLKEVDLERARLSQGHAATAARVQVEVAIVAEGLVVDAAVGRQSVLMIAHADFRMGHGVRHMGLLLSVGGSSRGWCCSFNHFLFYCVLQGYMFAL